MNDVDIQKMFYKPICSDEEIGRIFNVQNAEDYLLKLRADTVVDHMRLFRVMRNRYLKNETQWNFTKHFSVREFERYLSFLHDKDKNVCSNITKGFIFSNEPNGSCMKTDYGDIIAISESLRYFLFYMNLCYLDFDHEVPPDVRFSAQLIAIRTMLKSEALDFELDPRGTIPSSLESKINNLVEEQLEFTIGHEYAHYMLKHLDTNNLISRPLFRAFKNEQEEKSYVFYNYLQKQEFEADETAILRPEYTKSKLSQMTYNAILFFIYLDVYQNVSEQIFSPNPNFKTHPDPLDRMRNIYERVEEKIELDKHKIDELLKITSSHKEKLASDVGYNIEKYETYGSVYLGQWRGPVLRDRIDYY